jgi:hypothetical protein
LEVVWVPEVASQGFEEPHATNEQAAVMFSPTPLGPPTPLAKAAERVGQQLRTLPGFVGVAQGRTEIGDDAIIVHVEHQGMKSKIPKEMHGFPVRVEVVPGGFDILPA